MARLMAHRDAARAPRELPAHEAGHLVLTGLGPIREKAFYVLGASLPALYRQALDVKLSAPERVAFSLALDMDS